MPENENGFKQFEESHELAEPEPVVVEPASAADRQRAFEDEFIGKSEPRIDGKVQRGHGSKHSLLPQDVRTHHHALEQAVEAEKKLGEAQAGLSKAEAELETAESRVEATHKAVKEWPAKAQA